MGSNPIAPIKFVPLDIRCVECSRNDFFRELRLPAALDEMLAEDIGIQVGDGGVYIYKESDGDTDYRTECVGHAIEDRQYLENFVKPLKKTLFNLDAKVKTCKSAGACYLRIRSKGLVSFYHDVIGLPTGKKQNIPIPSIIRESPKDVAAAFLRGVGDTDFSLSFIKKTKRYHKYPVLHLGCQSKILVIQIEELLGKLGIKASTSFDCEEFDSRTGKTYIKQNLYISGKHGLKRWMEKIRLHNLVQYTRFLIWDKFGFCPSRTTLSQRIQMLDGAIEPEKFDN